jgi:hypothetical protein
MDFCGSSRCAILLIFSNKQQSQNMIKQSINHRCPRTNCQNTMTLAFVKCTGAEAVFVRTTKAS